MGCCASAPKPAEDAAQTPGTPAATSTEGPNSRKPSAVTKGMAVVFDFPTGFKGKYVLGKQLGQGSFGVTHECTRIADQLKAAVKIIYKSKLTDAASIEDVRKEVKILTTLKGKENVAEMYDVFEDEKAVYIVLECCTGGELFTRIVKLKKFSEKDAAVIIRQILGVVADCHLNGVVHRDLKPENFLYTSYKPDGRLKAIDFGLSDFFEPGQTLTDVVGSAYYVAPEVLFKKYGAGCDIWSTGVIMYMLLTGRPPFYADTEAKILRKIMKGQVDIESLRVSDSAKNMLRRMLVVDPRARMTASEALSHPWAAVDGNAPDVPLDYDVVARMAQFNGYSKLKKLFLKKVAETFDEGEIGTLRDQFKAIDTDGSGTITYNELVTALGAVRTGTDKHAVFPEDQVKDVLSTMDVDGDGQIDYMEFVAATLRVRAMENANLALWKRRTRMAFDSIDEDGNGFLDVKELEKEMGGGDEVKKLISEADKNSDGLIDYNEFCSLLRQVSARVPPELETIALQELKKRQAHQAQAQHAGDGAASSANPAYTGPAAGQ